MNTSTGSNNTSEDALLSPIVAVADTEVRSKHKRSSAARFHTVVAICEMLADLLTVVVAGCWSYRIYGSLALGRHIRYPLQGVVAVSLGFAVFFVVMLDRHGAYSRSTGLLRVKETERVLRVSAQSFVLALPITFFTSFLVSRWLVTIATLIVPACLVIQKSCFYVLVRSLHSKGYGVQRVLIYGGGSMGRRVFSALKRSPKLGLKPVVMVDENPQRVGNMVFELAYQRRSSTPVLEGPVTRDLVADYGADLVLVAIPSMGREKFQSTVREVLAADARVAFVPNDFVPPDRTVEYENVDGVLLASFSDPTSHNAYETVKRLMDITGAAFLILAGAPVFVLLSILVRLDSHGSALFIQQRVGKNGKCFNMFKFRTMYSDASEYQYSPTTPGDPRITRIGRFLRKTSLDELPQLFNVFKGEMSLVGPRPEMPFIVNQYNGRQKQRLQVKPGLTGLWQISGDRAYLIHENLEYDMYYIKNRGFFMDVAILIHTIFFAMRGV